MRFLADESCDARVAAALRDAGHDVVSVAATVRGAADAEVLDLARREQRIVLTEDRDFGRLVFASEPPFRDGGVLYLRCPESARPILPGEVLTLVTELGQQLVQSFVVWTPRGVRLRAFGES